MITEEMYTNDFSMPGMIILSFELYNNEEEVDVEIYGKTDYNNISY